MSARVCAGAGAVGERTHTRQCHHAHAYTIRTRPKVDCAFLNETCLFVLARMKVRTHVHVIKSIRVALRCRPILFNYSHADNTLQLSQRIRCARRDELNIVARIILRLFACVRYLRNYNSQVVSVVSNARRTHTRPTKARITH